MAAMGIRWDHLTKLYQFFDDFACSGRDCQQWIGKITQSAARPGPTGRPVCTAIWQNSRQPPPNVAIVIVEWTTNAIESARWPGTTKAERNWKPPYFGDWSNICVHALMSRTSI